MCTFWSTQFYTFLTLFKTLNWELFGGKGTCLGTILGTSKSDQTLLCTFLSIFLVTITPGCTSPPDAHHPRMRINPGWGRYQTLLLGFKSSIFLWYKHLPKFSNHSVIFYTLIITCQGHISDVSVLFEFLNWCFQTSWKSCDNNHDNNEDSVDDDSLNCLWRHSGTATFNLTILTICKDFSKLIFFSNFDKFGNLFAKYYNYFVQFLQDSHKSTAE